MSAKILLVEDNLLTARGLSYLLETEKYAVEIVNDLNAAEAALALRKYQLILLDISLPDGTGFDLAQKVRGKLADSRNAQTPIIFLTARDDEDDVVHGLELGAADYITKPFHNRELLLRIRKTLQPTPSQTGEKIGDFTRNADAEIILNGQRLALSPVEASLLTLLLENPERIVTREELLDEIYQISGKIVNDNTISVYFKRLRQKLGKAQYIETVKNLGYRLHPEGIK